MPWKEVKPMDQKVLFIADWLRDISSFTSLCRQYGISRKTGYKWIQRYDQTGVDGLHEASRKPHDSPFQTPYPVRQAILKYRHHKGMVLGPKKIRALLAEDFPNETPPSKTTIYNVLHSAGMIHKRRRKNRVAPFPQPFAPADDVNVVWSADFKGHFRLKDGTWCYPLTVMDHHSRYLLGCIGLEGPRSAETRQAFELLFQTYGLPQRIRTDNGGPFASKAVSGLSRLSAWWIRLGIAPERIEPGKPQQNGRHERMHRTLKQAATRPPQQNLASQQKSFDQFRQSYNQDRPHEALQQKTPASCYRRSERIYDGVPRDLHYPDYFEERTVQHNGVVYYRSHMIYVAELLRGQKVGLSQVDSETWDVYYGPVHLGRINERSAEQKSVSYISLKTVTHVP